MVFEDISILNYSQTFINFSLFPCIYDLSVNMNVNSCSRSKHRKIYVHLCFKNYRLHVDLQTFCFVAHDEQVGQKFANSTWRSWHYPNKYRDDINMLISGMTTATINAQPNIVFFNWTLWWLTDTNNISPTEVPTNIYLPWIESMFNSGIMLAAGKLETALSDRR